MWLLILLGFFTRLWQFGSIPLSLYWDEVAIGLDARSLLATGLDINGQPWLQALFYSYGDYKAPVYIWLTALLGKILPISQLTVRLPSLLSSLATAYLVYKLVKLVSAKKSKLPLYVLTSFLIMPWAIHFSRIGMESHLSLFWLTLSTYLIIYSAKKSKPVYLLLAALASSLGIYSYVSLRLMAPIIFIIAFSCFHCQKLKSRLLPFLLSLSIILISLIVLIRSPGYSASQQYRLSNDNLVRSTSYIETSAAALKDQPYSLSARLFHHRYLYKAREYLNNYFQYFYPHFLALSGDPNLRHHAGYGGQLLMVQAVLLVFGLFALINYQKPATYLILAWLLLSPAVAALVNETPHASRSIYMIIPLAWLIGLGMEFIFTKTKLKKLVILALTLNLLLFIHDYFAHYPQRSALSWLNPYKQAAIYFKDHPTDKDIYVTGDWYQPWLYFSFYADQQIKDLAGTCPPESLCVAVPDWQSDTTQTISTIPGTNQLVIKQSL